MKMLAKFWFFTQLHSQYNKLATSVEKESDEELDQIVIFDRILSEFKYFVKAAISIIEWYPGVTFSFDKGISAPTITK